LIEIFRLQRLQQIRSTARPDDAVNYLGSNRLQGVDYTNCCLVLVVVFGYLLDRLQSVLNADEWLVFSAFTAHHPSFLRNLHWHFRNVILHRVYRNELCSVCAFWHFSVAMD